MSRRRRTRRDDAGYASVVALGIALVVMVVAGAVAAAGAVVSARHRAEAVADMAALAAAKHALAGQDAACAAARALTDQEHVVLLQCRLEGLDALVTTGLAAPGRLALLGLAHGEARAGRR